MGVFQTYALDALTHVEEVLHGEVVLLLLQSSELAYLHQPLADRAEICGEGYFVDLFLAQSAQAALAEQAANLVKSYLMFEVVWVNHAAKVILFWDIL